MYTSAFPFQNNSLYKVAGNSVITGELGIALLSLLGTGVEAASV
jgi:hypothetical protein